MAEVDRMREAREQGRALIAALREHSGKAATGDKDAALALLYDVLPSGPDEPPQIRVTTELIQSLTPWDALAVEQVKFYGGEFNREFGRGSRTDELLDWDTNPYLAGFFISLGSVINGLTNPLSPSRNNIVTGLATTTKTFNILCAWADEQLAGQRA